MEAFERLKAAIGELDQAIERWEPARSRDDWFSKQADARALRRTAEEELLGSFDDAMAGVDDDGVLDRAHHRVAELVGRVACYLQLAGDARGFAALMTRAKAVSRDEDQQARLEAGLADPDAHVALCHGRWLIENERFDDAERVLGPVASGKSRPLAKAASALIELPRPLTSAPSMFRLNGCGQALYGERDRWPDGSYVSTLCICLLFIPILPIRAYRVRREGEGYLFAGKVPLSPFAKWARLGMLLSWLVGCGAYAVNLHYGSDSYKLGVALDEAQALEDAGDYAGAEASYRSIIERYGAAQDVSRAALGAMRIVSRSLPEPCTAADVDTAGRIMNALYELPQDDRTDAESFIGKRLVTCAEEMGDAEPAQTRARLAVLDMVMPLQAPGAADLRAATLARLGDMLAGERPLMALAHYMDIGSPSAEVLDNAQKIIDSFGEAPSLWLEAEPQIDKWIASAGGVAGMLYKKRLAAAHERDEADQALIEAGDESKLAEALATQPGDQALGAAVAGAQRQRGDLAAAIATLEGLGKPGRMTGLTLQLLGMCYRDADRLDDADALLSPYVDERLAAFEQAQRAYVTAVESTQKQIFDRLRFGTLPPALQRDLDHAKGEDAEREIVRAYMGDEIARDPHLKGLQDAFLAHQSVVPVAVTLAMVKLSRANAVAGEARTALLGAAEKLFLSIRGAAEGQPSYHLGLGEVYHRLGKAAEGDAELAGILAEGDATLQLEVASVYRALGKVGRAREIFQRVYDADGLHELKVHAAYMLSLVAETLDDQEKWLKASDPADPIVKAGLIQLRGQRAQIAGNWKAADAAYAEVAKFWESQAKHDGTALNNEAVAHMARFAVTGDAAHLRTAAALFEKALKLNPNAALTMGNLLGAVKYLGLVKLLAKQLKIEALAPGDGEAESLAWLILESDEGDAFREALSKQPDLLRALEIAKQLQVLAPHSPEGYGFELDWYRYRRDTAGLQKFHDRLAASGKLDVGDAAQQRRAFERGERDEVLAKDLDAAVEEATARLKRARATAHAPTIAAAEMLYGWTIASRYEILERGDMTDALKHMRAAHDAWPQSSTREMLARMLVHAAALKARAASTVLAKAMAEQGRALEIETLIEQLVRGADGGEVVSALRDQPELAEAMALFREDSASEPRVTIYYAAGWADDAALAARHAAVFGEPRARLGLAIDVLLHPGEMREEADLVLYEGAVKDRQ